MKQKFSHYTTLDIILEEEYSKKTEEIDKNTKLKQGSMIHRQYEKREMKDFKYGLEVKIINNEKIMFIS